MMTANYKAIVTVTWRFESDQNEEQCLEHIKSQLEKILNCEPFGDEFDGFGVQVDIAKMKERKRLIHIASFNLDEVFPYITDKDEKREYLVNGQSYLVRMNSDRYFVFRDNRKCVSCGLEGTRMMLDINPGDQSPHFNLYGEEKGRLVLLTKDHKLAKSKGGQDELNNYQTMCCTCNNLKGAFNLTLENCLELRNLYNNGEKLPRKELRELINKRREEMAKENEEKEKLNDGCEDKRADQVTCEGTSCNAGLPSSRADLGAQEDAIRLSNDLPGDDHDLALPGDGVCHVHNEREACT